MKRRLVAPVVGGLILFAASLASAQGDHGSCKAFGLEHAAVDAQVLRPSGRLVSEFARAGFINEHVAADHTVLCEGGA